jgi:hypothetical protein
MACRRNSLRNSASGCVLITSSTANQARRAWSMPKRMYRNALTECASVEIASLTPASLAAWAWMSLRSSRSGSALISRWQPNSRAAAMTRGCARSVLRGLQAVGNRARDSGRSCLGRVPEFCHDYNRCAVKMDRMELPMSTQIPVRRPRCVCLLDWRLRLRLLVSSSSWRHVSKDHHSVWSRRRTCT